MIIPHFTQFTSPHLSVINTGLGNALFQIFYPSTNKEVVYVSESDINKVEYSITGMTCTGCEVHIESEVNKLDGIIEVKANHEKGNTIVKYDKTK